MKNDKIQSTGKYSKGYRKRESLFWFGLFVFLLTALQQARIKIGPIPLYFSEVLLLVLLFRTSQHQDLSWSKNSRRILTLSKIYFLSIILAEIRGALEYQFILPAIYQIFRYGLGIYLLFFMPRLIQTPRQFQVVLKGAILGMILTGTFSVMTSLPPTRSVAMAIFSNPVLSPSKGRMLGKTSTFRGEEQAIRGSSLVGPPTFTAAYLLALWPFGLLAYRRKVFNAKWKNLSLLACFFAPIGALVTYGRMAWLGVSLIIGLIGLYGFSGSRKVIIVFAVLVMIIVSHIGLNSKLLYIERIERRTEATLHDPMSSGDVRERFLSYTEPFEFLLKNPSWLFAGSGSAGTRMLNRGAIESLMYDQRGLATHSGFAWAFYGFGAIGALSHLLLMLSSLGLILRNLKYTKYTNPDERIIWQASLASWLGGILPWWLFGHGVVSTARGSMFFFFIFAIFITSEQLRLKALSNSNIKP